MDCAAEDRRYWAALLNRAHGHRLDDEEAVPVVVVGGSAFTSSPSARPRPSGTVVTAEPKQEADHGRHAATPRAVRGLRGR
jgi:hypothetical protein